MNSTHIKSIHGRQIYDSRGRPTIEAEVILINGCSGMAAVPSGASTGSAEAHELRDHDPRFFNGLTVYNAVNNINKDIHCALKGLDAMDQRGLDTILKTLDGTDNFNRLGANSILSVSLAACRATAESNKQPLFMRIAELFNTTDLSIPMPMVNILSGGLHANGGMDVQDFLIIPASAKTLEEAIHISYKIRTVCSELLSKHGITTLMADEGGLCPGYNNAKEALQLIMHATKLAGLKPGVDILLAIDVAANIFKCKLNNHYYLPHEDLSLDSFGMISMIESWITEFPIASIEDPLGEEDWAGWKLLSERLNNKIQLVGDDLFTTNIDRIRRGIDNKICNSVLIKMNQNGTLTGTLDVIAECHKYGYSTIISARSGETEDNFISDLAVGTAAGQIKIGSVRNSDRLSKYNQLLRISDFCNADFSGMSTFRTHTFG